jgi:hypothetical protein
VAKKTVMESISDFVLGPSEPEPNAPRRAKTAKKSTAVKKAKQSVKAKSAKKQPAKKKAKAKKTTKKAKKR